jgi:hypothetical protein
MCHLHEASCNQISAKEYLSNYFADTDEESMESTCGDPEIPLHGVVCKSLT